MVITKESFKGFTNLIKTALRLQNYELDLSECEFNSIHDNGVLSGFVLFHPDWSFGLHQQFNSPQVNAYFIPAAEHPEAMLPTSPEFIFLTKYLGVEDIEAAKTIKMEAFRELHNL